MTSINDSKSKPYLQGFNQFTTNNNGIDSSGNRISNGKNSVGIRRIQSDTNHIIVEDELDTWITSNY